MEHYKPTHSLAIIYVLSWLPPRHALGDYKLTCTHFHFSPPLACGLWALPNPNGSSWLIHVLKLSGFSSPLRCSLVLLPCGVLSWYSVVLLLRSAVSCAHSRCCFVCSFVGCTAVHGLKVYSIVVAGSYYSYLLWERGFGFQSVHSYRWRRGFNTLVPGCSLARPSQVRICNYTILISTN